MKKELLKGLAPMHPGELLRYEVLPVVQLRCLLGAACADNRLLRLAADVHPHFVILAAAIAVVDFAGSGNCLASL